MKTIALFLASILVANASPFAVERMPNPVGVDPQIGGIDLLPDGRIAAVFHRGEILFFNPADRTWTPFGGGLHEPLGVIAESASSLLILQRAELTRVRDTDGKDGADDYETVFDGFGMSGNYHEFAFGPARGPDGSIYIALNLASNGAGVREEIRGEWSDIGTLDRQQMIHDGDWRKRSERAYRMYSRVPWRGWVLRLSPDGKSMEPFACGFRSPEGIGFDADGHLLVTDNEGDWRGTSPLYTVEKGGFYGHPASLVWREGWSLGDPTLLPVEKLQEMRTPETARFPQGDLANSPTQPVVFPENWGPYAGQTLLGEMNQNRMVRFLPDEVGGFRQGALIPIFDGTPLGNGNHRLAFSPDGALWVGKTHLSWAGAEGLVKVTLREPEKVFTVTSVKLKKDGGGHRFEIGFNLPVAKPAAAPGIETFDYHYHRTYGSPKVGQAALPVKGWSLSEDGKTLSLAVDPRAGAVHRIDLSPLESADGLPIEGRVLYYQASRLE